jgi:gas vesicle protein
MNLINFINYTEGGSLAKSNAGKYVGVGLLGAALGAIAGVLFAPQSGKATRRKIASTAKKAERKTLWGLKKAKRSTVRGARRVVRRVKKVKLG